MNRTIITIAIIVLAASAHAEGLVPQPKPRRCLPGGLRSERQLLIPNANTKCRAMPKIGATCPIGFTSKRRHLLRRDRLSKPVTSSALAASSPTRIARSTRSRRHRDQLARAAIRPRSHRPAAAASPCRFGTARARRRLPLLFD